MNNHQQTDEEDEIYGEEEDKQNKEQDGNEQNDDSDEPTDQKAQKPKIVLCKSSVNLARSHDSQSKTEDCSYCHGKRVTISGIEENVPYYKCGWSSTKFRVDDYEAVLNQGFSRCGTYFYIRNLTNSCCEPYQYRVDSLQFKPSHSQRKLIKRFHKYINYGYVKEENKDVEMKEEYKDKDNSKNKQKQSQKDQHQQLILMIKQVIELECSQHLNITQDQLKKHSVVYNNKFKCISSNIIRILPNIPRDQIIDSLKSAQLGDQLQSIDIKNEFINMYFGDQEISQYKQNQPKKEKVKKPKKQEEVKQENNDAQLVEGEQPEMVQQYPQNHYKNYCLPFNDHNLPQGQQPVHNYTIEIHRAMYTEELFDLYKRYELAVHKKEREPSQLQRFLCNSPIYDPDRDIEIANSPSKITYEDIDSSFREFKDEGVYPGYGTFHMYHRIDGKLVAVSVIDILKTVFVSAYCFYDTSYNFISLGVVTAIREFEYMRMIRQKYNQNLKWYQLGEMSVSCSKVSYKISYKPGYIICPRTKRVVSFEQYEEQIRLISTLPTQDKIDNGPIQFCDPLPPETLQNEKYPEIFSDLLAKMPFIYQETQWLTVDNLNPDAKKIVQAVLKEFMKELTFNLFRKLLFELKFPPKKPNEEQNKQEDPNENKQEEQNEEGAKNDQDELEKENQSQ